MFTEKVLVKRKPQRAQNQPSDHQSKDLPSPYAAPDYLANAVGLLSNGKLPHTTSPLHRSQMVQALQRAKGNAFVARLLSQSARQRGADDQATQNTEIQPRPVMGTPAQYVQLQRQPHRRTRSRQPRLRARLLLRLRVRLLLRLRARLPLRWNN